MLGLNEILQNDNRHFALIKTTEFTEYVVLNEHKDILSAGPFMLEYTGMTLEAVINTLIFNKIFIS